MRQLATYSFSSPAGDIEKAKNRHAEAISIIEKWLLKKGAEAPFESDGFFHSKTSQDNTGIYTITKHQHDGDDLIEYSLEEKSNSGLDFFTNISVLYSDGSTTIFCTLNASSPEAAILNAYTDARCPSVIRDILSSHDDWTYAGNDVARSATKVDTEADVVALVHRIKDAQSRKVPLVVVSEYKGEEAWPGIADKLARDLIGAAEVVRITDAGCKILTTKVGKKHSCYLGAIRLYWPATDEQNLPKSFVWTEEALLPEDEAEDAAYANRFQSKLRNLILSATAISVTPPKRIKHLLKLTATKELQEVRKSSEERIEQLQKIIDDLNQRLEEADHRYRKLTYQLQQSANLAYIAQVDEGASNDEENAAPTKGEVRFYKKIANAGKADKMVQTNDCGHTSWQPSNGADKAKKGLARLIGSDDWKSVQHCGTCTGGGVWRVEW